MASPRTLELTLISAKDVQDVNLFSKMEVYAVASIDGDPRTQQRTPADRVGGRSPSWNHSLRLPVPSGDPSRHALVVLLRSQRALGDRVVGEVRIPLSEILSGAAAVGGPQSLSYQVRKPSSGKPKGVLNLSYKFSDPIAVEAKPPKAVADLGSAYLAYPPPSSAAAAYPPPAAYPPSAYPPPSGAAASYPPPAAYPPSAYPPPPVKESKVNVPATAAYPPPSKASSKADEPVTAYPAPGPSTGSSYPPPVGAVPYPPQGGYQGYTLGYPGAPPPPAGYAYQPPQNGGYGYPPQAVYGYGQQPMMAPQAPKKKNKFGMGLGAGLLGGALGGMLIGDMVSDSGFDDGGGFDF